MRNLFLLILILAASGATAQNYECLQSGVQPYYINANGYLRAIRIDSVRTFADSVIYYPFRTPRGEYAGHPLTLDTNGGSWVGKKVVKLNDGTFLFDNYWGDTVLLKTQANVGDSWVFYSDAGAVYYRAAVTAKDTMSVLAAVDSVKRITVSAYNSSGPLTTDPMNGLEIVLSKEHGFVQVCDLYMFPYHKPDSVYREGLDYYMDRATRDHMSINESGGAAPAIEDATFKMIDFIIPSQDQLHSWNETDMLESRITKSSPFGPTSTFYVLNTVASKVLSGSITVYTLNGNSFSCTDHLVFPGGCPALTGSGVYSTNSTTFPIVSPGFLPEFGVAMRYIFYYPDDTSFCTNSPLYRIIRNGIPHGISILKNIKNYKLGIGAVYSYANDESYNGWEGEMIYTKLSGNSCGTYVATEITGTDQTKHRIEYRPNPVRDELTITSAEDIEQVVITDVIGRVVHSGTPDAKSVRVNAADWTAGLYFVRVNNVVAGKVLKQ
ncbi:MAG: T9SS type A sorting domain-containing protein [Bacteroidota bacterium]